MARAQNMEKHGHRPDQVVNGVIAPIADWSTDDVLTFLIDREVEKFPADYRALIEFYGASSAGECMITPESHIGPKGACSARSGCFTCQRVSTDHSMVALTQSEDYAYLAPLLKLNEYLSAIRWDLNRRHWIGREVNPATGCVQIAPNAFSFEECDRLLRMVLTLDKREAVRARAHGEALAAGEIKDTPRNRRLATPQFRNLDMRALIAIDFMRSVDCFGPPHSALAAWRDVYVRGMELDIPEIAPVPRPNRLPRVRFVELEQSASQGLFDPLMSLAAEVHYREDGKPAHPDCAAGSFEVSQEAADWFLLELPGRVERADHPDAHPIEAARYYLRLGTIDLPKGYAGSLDTQMRRSLALYEAGLRYDTDCRHFPALGTAEHDELLRAAAESAGVLCPGSELPATPAARRKLVEEVSSARCSALQEVADPRYWVERATGLACALEAGVCVFDGVDLAADHKRAKARARELAPAPVLERIQRETWALAEAIDAGEGWEDASGLGAGLFPWIAIGAGCVQSARPDGSRQVPLFEIAA